MNSNAFNRPFGSYHLLKRLGVGGMAETFLALSEKVPGVRKIITIKRMLESYSASSEYESLFYHEARLSMLMQHPNVLDVWDCMKIDGRSAMIMAFLHGVTVGELLERASQAGCNIPIEISVWIAIQALDGLDYVHHLTDESGVPLHAVHRDISPQNIFVCYTGLCKIFDFGVARYGSCDVQAGRLVGKCAYLSPEQCMNEAVDGRSDIFSLAAILYEMLTGKPAFARENDIKTLEAVNHEDPLPPSRLDRHFPAYLSRSVMQGLEKDPDRRYQRASEFAADLRTALKVLGKSQVSETMIPFMHALFSERIAEFQNIMTQACSL